MAKVRVRGKGLHGDYVIEAEVAEEHAAAVMASAVEKAHGSAMSFAPSPIQREIRQHTRKALTDFGPEEPRMSAEEATLLRAKVPSTEQVEEFILKQPDRLHSHPAVSMEFFGKVAGVSKDSSRDERRLFYILHRRIEDARRRIEKRDRSGKFAKDAAAFGTRRVYRWQREGTATA
jgi:hypothetical protein